MRLSCTPAARCPLAAGPGWALGGRRRPVRRDVARRSVGGVIQDAGVELRWSYERNSNNASEGLGILTLEFSDAASGSALAVHARATGGVVAAPAPHPVRGRAVVQGPHEVAGVHRHRPACRRGPQQLPHPEPERRPHAGLHQPLRGPEQRQAGVDRRAAGHAARLGACARAPSCGCWWVTRRRAWWASTPTAARSCAASSCPAMQPRPNAGAGRTRRARVGCAAGRRPRGGARPRRRAARLARRGGGRRARHGVGGQRADGAAVLSTHADGRLLRWAAPRCGRAMQSCAAEPAARRARQLAYSALARRLVAAHDRCRRCWRSTSMAASGVVGAGPPGGRHRHRGRGRYALAVGATA